MTQISVYLKPKILDFYRRNKESINLFIKEEINRLPEEDNLGLESGELQKVFVSLSFLQYRKLRRYCRRLGKKQSGFVTELIYQYQQMVNTSQPTDTEQELLNSLGGDV